MTDRFQKIIEEINPGAKLNSYQKLEGGVSAQVFRLDTTLANGRTRRLIVRQYGSGDLESDSKVATHESLLLRYLKNKGIPCPAPFYTDESCRILSSPYIVVEFIDGQTVEEPKDATDFVRKMAEALASIHEVDATDLELSFLPDQQKIYTAKLSSKPLKYDESLSESLIRDTLEKAWPPASKNKSVILHGDFWPGNTMWRNDNLVGIIDWEDAGRGDPLADLGNGRLEILMFFGKEAMDEFTIRYKTLMPGLDYDNLPYWDLCAALRPAGKMAT